MSDEDRLHLLSQGHEQGWQRGMVEGAARVLSEVGLELDGYRVLEVVEGLRRQFGERDLDKAVALYPKLRAHLLELRRNAMRVRITYKAAR